MNELERDVEQYLVRKIKDAGGLCWKFVSPGTRGVPDRWCVLAGKQFFVELKKPNARRRSDEKLQAHRAEQIKEQGLKVYRIASKPAVDLLLKWIIAGHLPKPERIEVL
ncbi:MULTISPECIES: VRR-NUC domain-containing protein [Allobaculum]|uniref:VRR-NUC domain-containing protein n=1 Tax=Allobaculum TaxID=174708 RepID=UPI001E60DFFB|nr:MULTISPECIES: VRR-NUC domain-containing protein [Allobaculum]UNT92219.1 VRR-NUC domain-containing protein [Allobaculum sp. Allo2]